ncbi:helix-turn-helix domain-containing protein [Cohnella nanjingensis]|uniref:Helix-turn-helix transcriptional regulator n=1 Tax=Cohnella nanjingensis TaxID=1387779 RepID=A0A7X0RWI2_9BACL|nr:AraC family transcriptional regulator [Cohnella nanjingensis]MBB6674938.1 helix-turn-helix transcriptional regulator [Cohnella nanjingensis]
MHTRQQTAVADTHADAVNEEVIYQHPLLFHKIWELSSTATDSRPGDVWNWHYHKEVEFIAIVDGHLAVQTMQDLRTLGPGDVMVLGSSRPHRTHKASPEPIQYIVFQVDLPRHFDQSILPYLNLFSELTQPLEQLNYIFDEQSDARREAHALILDIFEESQREEAGYEIAINSSIKLLLLLLLRRDNRKTLHAMGDSGLTRFRPVLDYVDQHLGEKIAVDDARALLNMSYHHFIKTFKRTMGIPFVDYVNFNRIKKAERLLLTTELSIMEISFEVGIWNMAQFYKLFKRHNQHSPKEFRLRMRG